MQHLKGIILIIIGAMLWGATGPLTEWILKDSGMTVNFSSYCSIACCWSSDFIIFTIYQ